MAIGDKKSAVMQSDIVNDFTTGGSTNVLSAEMGKTLAQRPNPNLLDNWYFGNPVDQRGGYVVLPGTPYYKEMWTQSGTTSSYIKAKSIDLGGNFGVIEIDGVEYYITEVNTTCVRGYTGAGYGIDRWKLTAGTLLIKSEGLTIDPGDNTRSQILIVIEDATKLYGKTHTLSVVIGNELYFITNTISESPSFPIDTTKLVTNGISLYAYQESATSNLTFGIRIENGYKAEGVNALKLELGSQQTLAHQDADGNWVLNEIPNYAEQLLRCSQSTADANDTYANGKTGFAPAGFGLGMGAKQLTSAYNLDSITANGWYWWYDTRPAGALYNYCHMRVDNGYTGPNTSVTQTIYRDGSNSVLRRFYAGGVWITEWDTPEMLIGVEYRTTERNMGKPVYTKLVDFGALPNASAKDYVAGDNTCSPIRVSGYVYKTGENERFETIDGGILPTSSVQSDYNDVWISALRQVSSSGSAQTNMIIHIRTRKDFSSKMARVQVWYTKTTD